VLSALPKLNFGVHAQHGGTARAGHRGGDVIGVRIPRIRLDDLEGL
jgi:hypothetical protein